MIQINLLPHREIRRRARQRVFMAVTISVAVFGLFVVLLGHLILQKQLENQQARNQFLVAEIAGLDAKIAQIKQLKEETEALLARKNVVETLQSNRTETVHLLDELVRQMPDGVYLKTMRQSGTKITLEGYAQSNARVSTLMENLERSPWLAGAELLESKQVSLNNQRLHEFSLEVQLKYDAEQDKQRAQQQSLDPAANATGGAAVDASKKGGGVIPTPVPVQPANQPGKPVPPAAAPGNLGGHAQQTPQQAHSPVLLGGLPTPESVRTKVTQTISSGQKRSTP